MEKIKPWETMFLHDCDKCIFLGRIKRDCNYYDLYCCPSSNSIGGSVIARYGNEGYEYSSGDILSVMWGNDESILKKAARLAYEKSLFKITIKHCKED